MTGGLRSRDSLAYRILLVAFSIGYKINSMLRAYDSTFLCISINQPVLFKSLIKTNRFISIPTFFLLNFFAGKSRKKASMGEPILPPCIASNWDLILCVTLVQIGLYWRCTRTQKLFYNHSVYPTFFSFPCITIEDINLIQALNVTLNLMWRLTLEMYIINWRALTVS